LQFSNRLRDIDQGEECRSEESFKLLDNKPWSKRRQSPLIPQRRVEAFRLFKRILLKGGRPPISLIHEILKSSKEVNS